MRWQVRQTSFIWLKFDTLDYRMNLQVEQAAGVPQLQPIQNHEGRLLFR
jgi:hypothetical protein